MIGVGYIPLRSGDLVAKMGAQTSVRSHIHKLISRERAFIFSPNSETAGLPVPHCANPGPSWRALHTVSKGKSSIFFKL